MRCLRGLRLPLQVCMLQGSEKRGHDSGVVRQQVIEQSQALNLGVPAWHVYHPFCQQGVHSWTGPFYPR